MSLCGRLRPQQCPFKQQAPCVVLHPGWWLCCQLSSRARLTVACLIQNTRGFRKRKQFMGPSSWTSSTMTADSYFDVLNASPRTLTARRPCLFFINTSTRRQSLNWCSIGTCPSEAPLRNSRRLDQSATRSIGPRKWCISQKPPSSYLTASAQPSTFPK